MSTIQQLPEDVIVKIAAGEVIERPVSIIKELIDNAIDANATEINIELTDGGNSFLRVTDNGKGIPKEELLIAIKPHTTSKIHSIEDLEKIQTLGFRGEALASIDHVATLTLESREKTSPFGWKTEGQTIEKVGMATGTRVVVTQLFDKIPARKKFLKSANSEVKLIIEIVHDYVLSHPSITFSVENDKKQLLLVSKGDITQRAQAVFGKETTTQFLEFEEKGSYLTIRGALTKPQVSAPQNTIKLFVNGRRVTDQLVSTAIKDAYSNLLFPRSFPLGFLFIVTPPELTDVNVHPTKREVRFSHPKEVYEEVYRTVLKTLTDNNLTYANVSFRSEFSKDMITSLEKDRIAHIGDISPNSTISQYHNLYLTVETKEGVMFIDQHAAHESILYYKLLDIFTQKEQKKIPTPLSTPYLFEATARESLIIDESAEKLTQLGFEVEPFGKNTYRIVAVPKQIADRDISAILPMIEYFIEAGSLLDEKNKRTLATLACKAAIKANQQLTQEQMRELVDALTSRNYAYTCPHGRPVKIEITLSELDRLFKRK